MKQIRLIVGVLLCTMLFSSCSYNTIVSKEEAVNAQWAQVENAYQRRADLIPNLVSTVKGYANFESSTLEAVTNARANATSMNISADDLTEENLKKYREMQGELGTALGRLLSITENYPELKANQNFLELQSQLEGSENRIAVERKRYNDLTNEYNAYIRKFPQVIYAGMFGFKKKPYFEADASAREVPKVEF